MNDQTKKRKGSSQCIDHTLFQRQMKAPRPEPSVRWQMIIVLSSCLES